MIIMALFGYFDCRDEVPVILNNAVNTECKTVHRGGGWGGGRSSTFDMIAVSLVV